MIQLHITLYQTEEGDRFKVNAVDPDDPEKMSDVTEDYEVVAIQTPDGRGGFAVLQKADALALVDDTGGLEG